MNLDLFSINLKSKSKYTTPRVPLKTNLIVEKRAKLYPTPNSAKKSRFVPPIAIPLSDLDEFEEKSDRKSSHVKFLTEQKDYSTPRSIQTFIMYNNGDLRYSESAIKIQRTWKAYIRRKRFHNFITFVFSIQKKRKKFAFHLWLFSLKKPANISKNSYEQVIYFMQSNGYVIKQDKNQNLITKDKLYNVNNFNQSMQTDFLFIQPRYPQNIIRRYQRNFYFPLIQKIFSNWFSIASEKLALRRTSRPMQELTQKRSLFGPMFWTFYFWKRWTQFRKSGKIPTKKNQLFLTEWSIYISKKKRQKKLNSVADKVHQRYIKSVIITNLQIKSANRSVYNKAYENVTKNRENLLMMTSLRAFNVLIAMKQFNSNIKRRIIRKWYEVIDSQITSRMKEKVLKYRSFLKCLKNSFKKWQIYVNEEGLIKLYLHNVIIQNNLLMLKTFFLLKSDFPHFAFVSAFLTWKKLLIMNHNKRRFINWSLTKARQQATLQSLLNIFKQNAAIPSRHQYLHPFKSIQKEMSFQSDLIRNSNSSKKANKKRLLKARKQISDELPVINVVPTTHHHTIRAFENLNDYEKCDVNWSEKVSSDEVKTLFYRLVLIHSHKKSSNINVVKSQKEKVEAIKKFRSDNLLFNINEIRSYRVHQSRQDMKRQLQMRQVLKRDMSLFMAFDTHEAAISLHKISNIFEINQIPIEDVTSIKVRTKQKSKKKNKNSSSKSKSIANGNNENKSFNYQNNFTLNRQTTPNRDRPSKEQNQEHPLLGPIENVKKSIDMNDRKYRRRPEDIFEAKESSTAIHNLRLINKLNSTVSQAKFQLDNDYEQFTPLRQSLRATRMMSSREFLLKELSDMHETATTDLEKINEGSEYTIFTKADNDAIKDDDLFEKEVILPAIEEIPTVLNTNIQKVSLGEILSKSKINFNASNVSDSILTKDANNQNDEKVSSIDDDNDSDDVSECNSFDGEISLSDLSRNFVNDPGYFEYTDSERAAMLSNKYLRVLEMLIDDSPSKPQPPNFLNDSQKVKSIEGENDQMRTHISSLIRRAIPRHIQPEQAQTPKPHLMTNTKPKKKPLFEDPDQQFDTIVAGDGVEYKKSNCPEFSNVAFNGDSVLTNTPWDADKSSSGVNSPETSPKSSSSPKKLKKRKKKHGASLSDDDDDNDNDSDEDDREFNMTSLPKPTFKILGFENDDNPINNSGDLLNQINSFLSSSCSTVDDQELLIEKLRQEAESSQNSSEEVRRALMLLIDAVVHKYVINQLDANQQQMQISQLVDVDGASSREMTSDDESSFSTIVIHKKLQKGKFTGNKKFAAFDTDSRRIDPPEVIERKFTFTKDLLAAISENAKFASTLRMRYYSDVTKLEPFKMMKSLEKRIRQKLESLRKKNHIVTSSSSYNNKENEVILSIGDVTNDSKNKQQKKARPVNSRPLTAISKKHQIKKNTEFSDLAVSSRPRTPLIDGCAKPEPSKIKVVRKPVVNKRKPQFTKMKPKYPTKPPEFTVSKDYNDEKEKLNNSRKISKTMMLSGPPAKLKWNLPSDRINITDEDIDFFVFVTPYVMPPEILNNILDRQEKKNNKTI